MKILALCVFLSLLNLPANTYAAKPCPTTFNPSSFTTGNFFSNFDNSCYYNDFVTGHGAGNEWGDLDTEYNKIFFRIDPSLPPYQLVVVGDFPNARYFSVDLNDNHSAVSGSLVDVQIAPLTSGDVNPYQPGVAFVKGQEYAVPVNLGGTYGSLEPGCVTTGYNFDVNAMDGTLRHPFMNWNLDATFFHDNPTMPLHDVDTPEHSNPNNAGVILIRNYLDLTPSNNNTEPHLIVRDMASGCAYPASMVASMNILTTVTDTGNSWLDQQQVQEHNVYASWQATQCWGIIPASEMQIIRGDEYIPGPVPEGAYLYAYVPSGLPVTLANNQELLRMRFRVPTTPPTPCTDGCSRSGNEQMRYMSLSFDIPGGSTLASLPDGCPITPIQPCTPLVQDPNGYVTVIAGTGTPQPSWVTPANGYTWIDLTTSPYGNYQTMNQIMIRNIIPSANFDCAGELVPYKTGQATSGGKGLLGLYAPVIDYPLASTLPTTASELTGNSSCAEMPYGPGEVSPSCGVTLPLTPAIAAVSTQCVNPGCRTVVVQPQPPISVLAVTGGFGTFPLGLPYTGNSNYFQLTDVTQNWSAGYTGDACTVEMGEWSDTSISLIANVNQNGVCPMAAGDQLTVTVWNPQTLLSASSTVTVQAQSSIAGR